MRGCTPDSFTNAAAPIRLGAFIVAGVMTHTAALAGNDDDAALTSMFDTCAAGPTTLDQARSALTAAGWVEDAGDNEGRSLFRALVSNVFAARFDPNDAGFSAVDALFMGPQILGNSGLGPDQLSFYSGKMILGVLGIREGIPYCVAAGPRWMLDAATEQFAPTVIHRPGIPPRPVIHREAMIGDAVYADALVDLAAVAAFDPQVGTERTADSRMSREDYDYFLAEVAREANIHISSHAALQER